MPRPIVALLLALLLIPAFGTARAQAPTDSKPTSSSASSPRPLMILGIVPQSVTVGTSIRIMFSAPILAQLVGQGLVTYSERLSVSIGGKSAPISSITEDSITVTTPEGLPAGVPLETQIVGLGLRLQSVPDQAIVVESNFLEPLRTNWRWVAIAAAVALGTVCMIVVLRYYTRRREIRLRGEVEEQLQRLRFLYERQGSLNQGVSAPAETPAVEREVILPPPPIPQGLIDAITGNQCVLYWGGGLSAQAGYPTWRNGISDIIEHSSAGRDEAGNTELSQLIASGRVSLAVELLATRLDRRELTAEIERLWGVSRAAPPALQTLGQLPFANAVTNVWDSLIDQVFVHRRPNVLTGGSSESLEPLLSPDAFSIIRLWGDRARPDTILLTASEYRSAVSNNPTYARYLASLNVTQAHLFIGSSIDTIQEYLASAPRSTASRTHYALVPESEGIDAAREVFKARHNVELLVFRPSTGWPQVSAFIDNLAKAVARAPAARPVDVEVFKLKKVQLENIGPFESLKLVLDPSWTLLLGNNGCGKSTILRAIALVLCADHPEALAEGAHLLRSKTDKGFVKVTVGDFVYRTDLSRDGETIHVNPGAQLSPLKIGRWVALAFPPLRGPGGEAVRGPTRAGSRSPAISDVLPILSGKPDGRLGNLKQWLVNLDVRSVPGSGITIEEAELNKQLRDHFFKLLNEFVPGMDIQFGAVNRTTWQVTVIADGAEIDIDQVSQGTSSILAWVGTVLQRLYEIRGSAKDIQEQTATVLIDEIDAHLHPEWQQSIVDTLKKQFPKVQFVATTHSPLIVGELAAEQIYRVRPKGSRIVAEHPDLPVEGMGVAGLLTSEMFGLVRTVDSKTQEMLERQRRLSASEIPLSDPDRNALDKLNRDLETMGFRYQVRDPEYTKYLRERHLATTSLEQPADATARGSAPRIQQLLRDAAARVRGDDKKGDG